MDCRNFIYINWHNGREMSVVEGSASYHVRMQKYNEEENHIKIPLDVFADIINVDWARMFFSQMAYNQPPYDLVYKPTVEQDECLKKDSRFSTTLFHPESKFQKHKIKFTTGHDKLHLRANLEYFILYLEAGKVFSVSTNIYNPDVVSKKAVYYTFKDFKYNTEKGRMTKQHHLSIHHCEMMGLILKLQQRLEV